MEISAGGNPITIAVSVPQATPSAAKPAARQSKRANAIRTPRPTQGDVENTSSASPAPAALLVKVSHPSNVAGQANADNEYGAGAHQLSRGQASQTAAKAMQYGITKIGRAQIANVRCVTIVNTDASAAAATASVVVARSTGKKAPTAMAAK